MVRFTQRMKHFTLWNTVCVIYTFSAVPFCLHFTDFKTFHTSISSGTTASSVCKSLSSVIKELNGAILLSTFTDDYASQAASFSKQLNDRGLVGIAVTPTESAAAAFTQGCDADCQKGGKVAVCPEYIANIPAEPFLSNSSRCRGWRKIQYIKVRAIFDVLISGRDVMMLDLDNLVDKADVSLIKAIATVSTKKRSSAQRFDVLMMKRDHTGLWNFGKFYVRSTHSSRDLFGKMKSRVSMMWDQALFNDVLWEEQQSSSAFVCLSSTKPMKISDDHFVKKTKHPTLGGRCGLGKYGNIFHWKTPFCRYSAFQEFRPSTLDPSD
jgi:hypothetical protein